MYILIKDITSEQRTSFNVPNGDSPIVLILLTSDKGPQQGQNGQKTMGPKRVRYLKVPLYPYFLMSITISSIVYSYVLVSHYYHYVT